MPKLTKSRIDQARPLPDRDSWLYDDDVSGFCVRVWPSGKKVYTFIYRPLGTGRASRQKRITIGTHGAITVDQAREIAKIHAGDVARGNDPAQARQDARSELAQAWTLDALLDAFLLDRGATEKTSTVKNYRQMMDLNVRPSLGRKRAREVTRADVTALHRSMHDTPYQANRVLAVLSAAFTFGEEQGQLEENTNPCGVGRKRIKPYDETARKRAITDAEYTALGAGLEQLRTTGLPVPAHLKQKPHGLSKARRAKLTGKKRGPYKTTSAAVVHPANPTVLDAIRFLMLSGWREQEALTLAWSAIDFQRSRVVLGDTKTGQSTRILGADAIALLKAREPQRKRSAYVFPHHNLKKPKPIAEVRRPWEVLRDAAGCADLRIHDLRHGFATVGSDEGIALHVIGALLGHEADGVTAGYAAPTDDTKRRAADRIAGHIAAALSGESSSTTVLPIAKPA